MLIVLEILAVCAFYVTIFAYYQPTLLSQPSSVISDYGDGILNLWMLEHGLKALPKLSLSAFWSGNIFFPLDRTMSLSDTLLFQVLLSLPLTRLGLAPITVYNILIPLFFTVNGVAAYLSLRLVCKDPWLSILGSGLFAISGFWFGHLGHYQLLPIFWYPLILGLLWQCYVHRGETYRQKVYWSIHALALVGLGFSSPYLFFLFVPSLLFIYGVLLIAVWRDLSGRQNVYLGLTLCLSLGVIGFFYLPYLEAKTLFGMVRDTAEQALYSVRWRALRSHAGLYWPTLLFGPAKHYGEGQLYLSIVTTLGLFAVLLGTVRGKLKAIPATQRLLTFLFLFLGLTCLLASMGPNNRTLGPANIWRLWSIIPGFSGMRVPARLGFLVMLYFGAALSVYLSARLASRWRQPLAIFSLLVLIFEMKPAVIHEAPYSEAKTAGLVQYLNTHAPQSPLLMYPLNERWFDIFVVASKTQNPLVNGRSGWTPYLHEHLIFPQVRECIQEGCLMFLRHLGVRFIALPQYEPSLGPTRFFLESSAPVAFKDQAYTLFDLGAEGVAEARLYKGDHAYLGSRSDGKSFLCKPLKVNGISAASLTRTLQESDPMTVWRSPYQQNYGATLRFSLPPQTGSAFTLLLSDGASTIPTSGYVRRPLVRGWAALGVSVPLSFWTDLSLQSGQIVQEIHVKAKVPLEAIEIESQSADFVTQDWVVGDASLCAFKQVFETVATNSQGVFKVSL